MYVRSYLSVWASYSVCECVHALDEVVPKTLLTDWHQLQSAVGEILVCLQRSGERRRRQTGTTVGRPMLTVEEDQLSFFIDSKLRIWP